MKKIVLFLLSVLSCVYVYSQEPLDINSATPEKVVEVYFPGAKDNACKEGYSILHSVGAQEIEVVKYLQQEGNKNSAMKKEFFEHAKTCPSCSKLITPAPEISVVEPAQEEEGPNPKGGPLDGILSKIEERFNKSDKAMEGILKEQNSLKILFEKLPKELLSRLEESKESFEGVRRDLLTVLNNSVRDRAEFREDFRSLKELIQKIKPQDVSEFKGLGDRVSNLIDVLQENNERQKGYEGVLTNLGLRLEELRKENKAGIEEVGKKFSPLLTLSDRLEKTAANIAGTMGWLLLAAVILGILFLIVLAVLGAAYTSIQKKLGSLGG